MAQSTPHRGIWLFLVIILTAAVTYGVAQDQAGEEREVTTVSTEGDGAYVIVEVYKGSTTASRENLLLDSTTGRVWMLQKDHWVLMRRKDTTE